jgi:predicted ABC-type ATPase
MKTWAMRRLRNEVRRRANAAEDRVPVKITRKDGWEQVYWKKPEDAKRLVEQGVGRVVTRQEAARTPVPPRLPGQVVHVPTGRIWIDKHPDLPETTWKSYFNRNPYDDEKGHQIVVTDPGRKAIHDRIREKTLNQVTPVAPDEQPVALLTMGGPASGKSRAVGAVDRSRFVVSNPDEIREELPEYQDAVDLNGTRGASAKNAATMTQAEASWLARDIRREAIAARKNVLIDGSGKDPDEYAGIIKDLKSRGYKVLLRATDVSADEGYVRAQERAEHEGRWVPEEYLRDVYAKIPASLLKVASLADDARLYSTHAFPPTEVCRWEGGVERVVEPSLWLHYQEKAKAAP